MDTHHWIPSMEKILKKNTNTISVHQAQQNERGTQFILVKLRKRYFGAVEHILTCYVQLKWILPKTIAREIREREKYKKQ